MLGRAKSCQWQVFVRRRPPKQGELRTDVSKATMFQGDDSVLRPRFKALSKKILAKFSDGTSRNRFFAQNGGEKALNRCEVRVLQRKDLERTSKEQPYSLRTVGYGWVRICGVFVCEKRHFSSSCKVTDKEKLFLSIEKLQSSTAPKLTCNNPFRISLATVSLQQDNSFSKLRNLASAL